MTALFENKVAIVTGGGSGIGRAIAERYVAEGAKVIIAGRRESVLKEVADANENISYVVADITKSEDIAKIIQKVQDDYNGQLDILANKGNIINISTVGAQHRGPNMSMYLGAKAAVENFTRVWSMELAADGVRVNAIAPGTIETDIWNQTDLDDEAAKAHKDAILSLIPLGYAGAGEDIANAAAYLGSDQGRYVTGAIIAVDGGMGAS